MVCSVNTASILVIPLISALGAFVFHLACSYSQRIWDTCIQLICAPSINNLTEIITIIVELSRGAKGKKKQLFNMFFIKSIYHIWIQRNENIFDDQLLHPQQVVRGIMFSIACRGNQDVNQMLLL